MDAACPPGLDLLPEPLAALSLQFPPLAETLSLGRPPARLGRLFGRMRGRFWGVQGYLRAGPFGVRN